MKTKLCVCCGKKIKNTGINKYCSKCRVEMKLLYNKNYMALKRLINKSFEFKKEKSCACCGKVIDINSKRKYCIDCKDEMLKIYHKHYGKEERQIKFKDRTVKKSESIKKALDEIKVSDTMFQTDRCNQDCDNCQYDDCILPEED